MTASSTDWRCTRCGESIPPTFEVCWKCGTTRDGLRDLFFQPERDVADEPPDVREESNSQYSLRHLFSLTTLYAIIFGALVTLPPPVLVILIVIGFEVALFAAVPKKR